jgi:urease accessory protein
MQRLMYRAGLVLAALVTFAVSAQSHTGVGEHTSIAHGLIHPFSGPDHVLAMLAVGIVAANSGGRLRFALPLLFIGALLIGGILGLQGVQLPQLEFGIGASVVVLGALVAFGMHLPMTVIASLVGVFGMFHGNAHGLELPSAVSPVPYIIGFVMATGILNASGFGFGLAMQKFANAEFTRLTGIFLALIGIGLSA